LWVDKHRPKGLSQMDYHDKLTKRLHTMSSSKSLPHLLFYGPSGSGKKTRIQALLRGLYGSTVDKLRLESKTFTTPTNRKVDINMISSNSHIEMTPSDAGIYDRFVIGTVLKEIASNAPLFQSKSGVPFKTVVLNEVDCLTKQAQAGLRRTMEKYTGVCRLVLVARNSSKVIGPLKSRCLGIRISSPTHDEITRILVSVASKENLTLSPTLALSISRLSSRNLRRALLMLESAHTTDPDLDPGMQVPRCDWEEYIVKLASEITAEQSPQKLLMAREMMYELLTNCIPAPVILRTLATELMKNTDDSLKHDIVKHAAYYEARLNGGSKEIFHLEAFVAKFMAGYKEYLTNLFG